MRRTEADKQIGNTHGLVTRFGPQGTRRLCMVGDGRSALNGGQKAALTKRPALQYGGGVGQRRIFAWLRRTAVAGVAAGGPVGGSLDVRFAPLRLFQFLSPLRVRRDQQFRNAGLSLHRVGHRKLHFLF
jgi:hypothetical protein